MSYAKSTEGEGPQTGEACRDSRVDTSYWEDRKTSYCTILVPTEILFATFLNPRVLHGFVVPKISSDPGQNR